MTREGRNDPKSPSWRPRMSAILRHDHHESEEPPSSFRALEPQRVPDPQAIEKEDDAMRVEALDFWDRREKPEPSKITWKLEQQTQPIAAE